MDRHIGLDPSLSSTAVCDMTSGQPDEFHVFTTVDLKNKWMKHAELFASLYPVQYNSKGSYSDTEVNKLNDFRKNAYEIIDTINCGPGDHVYMEGYASRAKGNIIDLVVFGTFVRERIVDSGAELHIITPMALKKNWAEAIYPKDKKGVARNNELKANSKGEMIGIAGGSFKKHQMMLGLYEMEEDSVFKKEMEMHRAEIMPLKGIPKPFDDCVDAFALSFLGITGKI